MRVAANCLLWCGDGYDDASSYVQFIYNLCRTPILKCFLIFSIASFTDIVRGFRRRGSGVSLMDIVGGHAGDELHFVVEEFDRRLSVGDILVILGPSREIRAFKKDVENEFCKI